MDNKRKEAIKIARTKHGHTSNNGRVLSPTYRSWISMKQRCSNEKHHAYPRYGGKGVTFCNRWDKFQNFLDDMGIRPDGTSLDRINPFGNYEPNNCRWADPKTQANNLKKNFYRDDFIETVKKLNKKKINMSIVMSRLNKGIGLEEALSYESGVNIDDIRKFRSMYSDIKKYNIELTKTQEIYLKNRCDGLSLGEIAVKYSITKQGIDSTLKGVFKKYQNFINACG